MRNAFCYSLSKGCPKTKFKFEEPEYILWITLAKKLLVILPKGNQKVVFNWTHYNVPIKLLSSYREYTVIITQNNLYEYYVKRTLGL